LQTDAFKDFLSTDSPPGTSPQESLIRESGGLASDFFGTELDDYDLVRCGSITAGNPQSYRDLIQLTSDAFTRP
jgi:hypothetical protein